MQHLKLDVDPQTYEVYVDGEKITSNAATELPLTQRYFLIQEEHRMIVEEIQGNIANLSNSEKQKHVEKVYLENSDLVKRIQRVVTDHGTENKDSF